MEITTERLLIRDLKEEDIPSIHEYAADPEVCRYVPWGPNTTKVTSAFVMECIGQQLGEPRVDFELAVIEKSSGRVIGMCGIHISDIENQEGWIGYVFNRKFWGRGYAREAASALLRLGFGQFKLHRIYATCHPDNRGSRGVLEGIGMVREGLLRKHLWCRGYWRDSLIYGILEEEFKE